MLPPSPHPRRDRNQAPHAGPAGYLPTPRLEESEPDPRELDPRVLDQLLAEHAVRTVY